MKGLPCLTRPALGVIFKIMTHSAVIEVSSKGFADIIDISATVDAVLKASRIKSGQLCVFVSGSTASVTTIEFESGVVQDLKDAIERLAPMEMEYRHDRKWGDGNGFAHVRAALLKPSITVPVIDGEMALGTWQQIVVMDFDNRPRSRKIAVQITGD